MLPRLAFFRRTLSQTISNAKNPPIQTIGESITSPSSSPTSSPSPLPSSQVQQTIIKSSTSSQPPATIEPSQQQQEAIIPAYETSCTPEELVVSRRVRIFKPCRNSMQSGDNETRYWQIDFDSTEKWENPLMGYVSRLVHVILCIL